jgi:hypothetical protein
MLHDSDRLLASKYKSQLKDMVENWAYCDDDVVSIITALCEATAEVGIAFVGGDVTHKLLSSLALAVDAAAYRSSVSRISSAQ